MADVSLRSRLHLRHVRHLLCGIGKNKAGKAWHLAILAAHQVSANVVVKTAELVLGRGDHARHQFVAATEHQHRGTEAFQVAIPLRLPNETLIASVAGLVDLHIAFSQWKWFLTPKGKATGRQFSKYHLLRHHIVCRTFEGRG